MKYIEPDAPDHHRNKFVYVFLILVIIVCTTTARSINLDADPVSWMGTDVGYLIDEGYKTSSPRNLLLFGSNVWHPEDVYGGWLHQSEITQWAYYFAFDTLGVKISSARLVNTILSSLLLTIVAIFYWRRNNYIVPVIAVSLLATDTAMLLFARSALFEGWVIFFTYIAVFIAASLKFRNNYVATLPIMALAFLAALYIKQSVLFYMMPPVLALILISDSGRLNLTKKHIIYLIPFTLIFAAILYATAETWYPRININLLTSNPHGIFLNYLYQISPLSLIMGYVVLSEALIRNPQAILANRYRLCLASIIVISPVMISLFIHNLPRFYAPIVPAALLLFAERFSMVFDDVPPQKIKLFSLVGLVLTIVVLSMTMTIWGIFNYFILNNIPINLGSSPGFEKNSLLRVYPLFLILCTIVFYLVIRPYWRRISYRLPHILAVSSIIIGITALLIVILEPEYRTKEIREKLISLDDQPISVGGDWAPFFVMDSNLKAIYMRPDFNSAEKIEKLRVDYFLNSNTYYDQNTMKDLLSNKAIRLENKIQLGRYAGNNIELYHIQYFNPQGSNF